MKEILETPNSSQLVLHQDRARILEVFRQYFDCKEMRDSKPLQNRYNFSEERFACDPEELTANIAKPLPITRHSLRSIETTTFTSERV